MKYQLGKGVLFLIFNRPHTTQRVFEAIRQVRPPRLYVAADGPRADREGEAEKVAEVRRIATQVDWPCEVKTLFREKNLGCKVAVSSAITWFFEHEEKGIILEDDCLPHPDFFRFCDELLDYYVNDSNVWAITGNNFQKRMIQSQSSYYFSKYCHIWGWATWRRSWEKYQVDIPFWPLWKSSVEWQMMFDDSVERRYWQKIFDLTYQGKIDTWDYQWLACQWYYAPQSFTATPIVNLVSNIGYGSDATHTHSPNHPLANLPVFSLEEILHPVDISVNKEADQHDFKERYGGKYLYVPRNLTYLIRRIYFKFSNVINTYLKYQFKKWLT
ncbi:MULTISPECIES: glycosyltransferase family 2 protein [unclassified Thermosynechococcus]|uniref:glycosyltransferase family 2 protein n=1 Tax=unclassified Thermosynechococcus TaxID=2622553 RepID=UPI002877B6C8|nr:MULTISPECIES: glycosyltransferase family 2 protein [unclassified Thermosynechococcus]WNC52875.1 glycosyltransferase family 2 protein [Thermosynechococcus sp. TG215]WNC57966.1 glycosyltransferase family 2 protein [Thermosynechococcus sp. TG218]